MNKIRNDFNPGLKTFFINLQNYTFDLSFLKRERDIANAFPERL